MGMIDYCCLSQLLEETDRSHMIGEPTAEIGRDVASVLKIVHALELRNEQSST